MIYKALLSIVFVAAAYHAPISDTKTIVFFGDSITSGYGLSKEQAFPALVEEKLKAKGYNCEVLNAGSSGETSAGGLTRIDWILKKPVDVFVLELGSNDGLRGVPLESTKTNLQKIIDKVKAKNPQVSIIVAGMMVPPNLGNAYTTEFKNIFPDLANKNNAKLIPFLLDGVAGNEDLNLPDGIHPNTKGHQIVADNIIDIIESELR